MVCLEWSGTNSWQLSRLAWNDRKVNTTYMLYYTILYYKEAKYLAKILKHEFVSDHLRLTMFKTMHLDPCNLFDYKTMGNFGKISQLWFHWMAIYILLKQCVLPEHTLLKTYFYNKFFKKIDLYVLHSLMCKFAQCSFQQRWLWWSCWYSTNYYSRRVRFIYTFSWFKDDWTKSSQDFKTLTQLDYCARAIKIRPWL